DGLASGLPGEPVDPGAGGGPAATAAPGPPITTAPPRTASTLPAPVIDRLALEPPGEQPNTYTIGRSSPTLTWSVSGATRVEVWSWFDDGASGSKQLRLESTDRSGSLQVCPGTKPTPTTCASPAGSYSYVVVATNADGTTMTTDQANAPGFQVLPPPPAAPPPPAPTQPPAG
ncbi:MAG: hypothetical protein JWM47_110, partial [Acidimicrobiales bacterium]|nr:hypothetical protein [Acidimicrobiales bacterium]